MIEREIKASTGSGDKKREFSATKQFPENYQDAEEILGDMESVISALNETLSRRYQSSLRAPGKGSKAEDLYTKMLDSMLEVGIEEEKAKKVASKNSGFIPSIGREQDGDPGEM